MSKIKDIVKTPSAALQAMVDGLREQPKRSDFKVYMDVYGYSQRDVLYGCAATCATQKIFGVNLTQLTIAGTAKRADAYGCDVTDLNTFEYSINEARIGLMSRMFDYYGVDKSSLDNQARYPGFELQTHGWELQLPRVEEYIELLVSIGY